MEDFQVRRHFVQGIYENLTRHSDWRHDRGSELLRIFYTDFDIMPGREFEEALPLDGVPAGFSFQFVDDPGDATLVTRTECFDWPKEGRQNCDMVRLCSASG